MPHWQTTTPNLEQQQQFVTTLGLHPITAQILMNRGVVAPQTAETFLSPRLQHLHDPYRLPDMRAAVDRLIRAILNGERILLFGDYDTDGVTGTALGLHFFRAVGVPVATFVPHRTRDGYGLTVGAIDRLRQTLGTPAIILTIDNGTTAAAAITHARACGIETIVTDHHEVPDPLPAAVAIVNPKRRDTTPPYPFTGLCGAGVMFKLCTALRQALREQGYFANRPEPNLAQWLDLVAIGTIADIVPLVDENRTFCAHGLKVLGRTTNIGLAALCRIAHLDPTKCTARQVAFQIAPRLNAAGRLGDANLAVELLATDDATRAASLAATLHELNGERQRHEEQILHEATAMTDGDNERMSIVAAAPTWSPGVVGIVAGRLAGRYRKPTILISTQEGKGIGSARGVGDFPLLEALAACAHLLERFGGHAKAAGLSLPPENIAAFRDAFDDAVRERMRSEYQATTLRIDAEIEPADITAQLVREIERLQPFGEGNLEPILCTRNMAVRQRRIVGGRHLKMTVHGGSISFDAIGFTLSDHPDGTADLLDLAFTPETNEWNGVRSIQLKLRDLKACLKGIMSD